MSSFDGRNFGSPTRVGAVWADTKTRFTRGVETAARPPVVLTALLGLGCGIFGWLTDALLGTSMALSWSTPRAGAWPPVAGIIYVTLISIAIAEATAALLRMFKHRSDIGLARPTSAANPWVTITPVWWAVMIRRILVIFAIVLCIGAVIALGERLSAGTAVHTKSPLAYIGTLIPTAFTVGVFLAVCLLISDAAVQLYDRLLPKVLASPRLWALLSVGIGLGCAAMFYAALLGVALLFDPFFVAASLGSTRTLTTAAAILPLAAVIGCAMSAFAIRDRTAHRADVLNTEPLPPSEQDNFRNWDLGVETSFEGALSNGLPFYIWRESADDRLGLSRPRYCYIAQRDGELYFTFFNPSKDVRSSGGLAIFIGVSVLFAIVALIIWKLTPQPDVPYIHDTRAPLLELIAIALAAPLLGGIAGGLWHVMATLTRWSRNRFEGDGRITQKPLRELAGFNKVHAAETDAFTGDRDKPKTGNGLTAFFHDGSVMYLTANAWSGPSIAEKHKALNAMFIERMHSLPATPGTPEKERTIVGSQVTSPTAVSVRATSKNGIPNEI